MITIRRVYLQRIGLAALAAALLATLTLTPTMAAALPTCVELGTNPAYGLAGNPQIGGLTATVVPLGPGVTVPYCRVDFTFSGESGPSAGYRPGQSEQIRLRVGLPLSAADGGIGGVQGAWNGKNRDLGGGGYAGNVGGVTSSTNLGYVGTSTDTGHNSAVQPGGSFALNPDNTLPQQLHLSSAQEGRQGAPRAGQARQAVRAEAGRVTRTARAGSTAQYLHLTRRMFITGASGATAASR